MDPLEKLAAHVMIGDWDSQMDFTPIAPAVLYSAGGRLNIRSKFSREAVKIGISEKKALKFFDESFPPDWERFQITTPQKIRRRIEDRLRKGTDRDIFKVAKLLNIPIN